MTLAEFACPRLFVVMWSTSHGNTNGTYTPLNYEYFDIPEKFGLWDLQGEIREGAWRWNGEGDPRDGRRNSYLRIEAYTDRKKWNQLVREYEES